MNIKTMQAAILVEQNQPLVVDEVELPTKLNFGQVLVKVLCSGICGSQLGEIDGIWQAPGYLTLHCLPTGVVLPIDVAHIGGVLTEVQRGSNGGPTGVRPF